MTTHKQCTEMIITIMPDGQFSLDRVLAISTDLILDPEDAGYDADKNSNLIYDVSEMLRMSGGLYSRAEIYTKTSKK